MPDHGVHLSPLAGQYAIARLPPQAPIPAILQEAPPTGTYISITRTPQELSIVCPVDLAPPGSTVDSGWIAFYASGPIPFGQTGVVTALVRPLSAAGCPVSVTSTFDGDVVMVPADRAGEARTLLAAAGHILT